MLEGSSKFSSVRSNRVKHAIHYVSWAIRITFDVWPPRLDGGLHNSLVGGNHFTSCQQLIFQLVSRCNVDSCFFLAWCVCVCVCVRVWVCVYV